MAREILLGIPRPRKVITVTDFAYLNLNTKQQRAVGINTFHLFRQRIATLDYQKPAPGVYSVDEFMNKLTYLSPAPALLIKFVWGYISVETLIKDYVSVILSLVSDDPARTDWGLRWAGEEIIHGLILEEYAMRSGGATLEEVYDFRQECRSIGWDPRGDNKGFTDPFYTLLYTVWQELYTANAYEGLMHLAKRHNDTALEAVCYRLMREEMEHHRFYYKMSLPIQEMYPEAFATLLRQVHEQFDMPARYTGLPQYDEWTESARENGVTPDFDWAMRALLRLEAGRSIPTPCDTVSWNIKAEAWKRYAVKTRTLFQKYGIEPPSHVWKEYEIPNLNEK